MADTPEGGGSSEPASPAPALLLCRVGGEPRVEGRFGVPPVLDAALAPGASEALDDAYRRAFAGETVTVDVPVDGRTRPVSVRPLDPGDASADADPARVLVTLDTPRSAADEAEVRARRSERVISVVERLAGVGHWEWDTDGDIVRWSPELSRFYGLDPGRTPVSYAEFRPYVHPDDLPEVEHAMARVLEEPGPFAFEHRVRRADGEVRLLRVQGEATAEGDGAVRILGASQDVTELRQAEDALRESEEQLRQLAENLRTIVWIVDLRAVRFLYVNPAFEEVYGLSREVLGDDPYAWLARVHPDDRPAVEKELAEVDDPGFTGYAVEHRVVRPDGTVRWLHVRATPVRDPETGRTLRLVGSGEDVTERRVAEQSLAESELRFRQIAENSHYMFWLRENATGQYLYVNPAYEHLFGGRVQDMYDDPHAWLSRVHPDDRARVAPVPDGVFDQEYRVMRPDGEVRWVRARSFPVVDGDGVPYRRVGVAEDVTDRRLLQEQLLQSQKMEAVGRLAGGIAHDFNNLLFVILNYVEEALQQVPPGTDAFDDLRHVVEAAERARSLTDQMLTFSRRQPAVPVDLDLNDAVRVIAGMLRRVLGEDVRVDLALADGLPRVRLDPTQLQQVLLNLAVNARDAMPQGGTLRLETSPSTLSGDARGGGGRPAVQPGVALRVSDTGHGMRPEVVAHAFEPFFTTKPVGQGTGLGLSSVYGIVQGAGGEVRVDTAPDAGTTVTLRLPATVRGAEGEKTPTLPGARVDGAGRVALVVEDEAMVRHALVRQLRRAGFVVHEAPGGAEALRLCQYSLWQVDLLVADLVMPGMSGHELVSELARLGLDPPVVFVSGYAGERAPEDLRGPGRRFLQKPFRAEQLLAVVEEVTAGREG